MRIVEKSQTGLKTRYQAFLSPNETDALMDSAFAMIASDENMAVGIASPRDTVLNAMDGSTLGEALAEVFMHHFSSLVVEHHARQIMTAPVLFYEKPFAEGKEFVFTVEVFDKPEYELASYEPVTIALLRFEKKTEGEQDPFALEARHLEQEDEKEQRCITALAERLTNELPEEILAAAYQDLMRNLHQQLRQNSMTLQEYFTDLGIDESWLEVQMQPQAREQLRQNLALDALVRHLDLRLSAQDYNDTYQILAPGQEELLRQEFENTPRMFVIEEMTLRRKALEWLVATANVRPEM